MNIRANLILLVLSFLNCAIQAQELIPMGTWRSHFNYEQTHLIEKTTSKIFAATSHGLMFYDQEDQSINKLSKVDGLSDVGITALAYNANKEYLAMGYQNGNVDVITSDGIQNLPVLLNSNTTGNKEVNHISFYNGNMNLSTDFGLLILTVENQVVEAYQNLGENGKIIAVRSSVISEEVMYLATEDGVLSASMTSGDNLQDFNNWNRFATSPIYGVDMVSIAAASGNVYTASAAALYQWSGGDWSEIALELTVGETILKVRQGIGGLLILTNQRALNLSSSGAVSDLILPNGATINDLYQENETTFWYADESLGLSKQENGNVEHIVLSGPLNDISRLEIETGRVYAFPALIKDFTNPISSGTGYSVFQGGEWTTLSSVQLNGFSNISDVLVQNDQERLASFGNGILNIDGNTETNYMNSPLQETAVGTGNTLVSGLALDQSENIWVANFSVQSLHRWNGADEWQAFDFGSAAASEPTSVAVNSDDQVWMTLGLETGFGALAYDIEADVSRYITTTGTSLPSNLVNDIAFGREGEIWFATDKGLAYFPFSFGVIADQTIDVSLPIFEERVLFEDKKVYALAVDGGNRLWVGAQDGLWLFNENIGGLVEHFTVNNSPLPSNSVIDLAIHPETGELFVATNQGVVSYRTHATAATNLHHQVKIFPNPVLPDFTGWVGMSGLVNDVSVKITTISGQLVREVNAAGGGASWDVRDYSGRRVSTGVYLVFSADQDGSETFVGKIAVID